MSTLDIIYIIIVSLASLTVFTGALVAFIRRFVLGIKAKTRREIDLGGMTTKVETIERDVEMLKAHMIRQDAKIDELTRILESQNEKFAEIFRRFNGIDYSMGVVLQIVECLAENSQDEDTSNFIAEHTRKKVVVPGSA